MTSSHKIFFQHFCPFVRGVLWSQVDPLHKWPVMWRFDVWFAVIQYQLSYRNFSCRWFEMQWRSYDVSVVLYCSVYLYIVCIAPLYPYYLSASINSSPLDKMATISQTILSDAHAFSWMKSFIFWLNFPRWEQRKKVTAVTFFRCPTVFHWSLFLRVQLTITQHWFR